MALTFDKALGIHQHALEARVKRAEVLANNMANADTPGYKARDMDFQAMMQQARNDMSGFGMDQTHPGHMDASGNAGNGDLLYRVPSQPSVDGNTVDAQAEQTRFMRNAMDYQASFQFLNSKFTGLTKALKGE